ncbi:kinase-like domain-containing protein [Gilbertella persicaria]|uniref:kinase-like domain-containing protein n=1 Tax=Gilbertella persicaria TaxID=101096 RepID=UPI00221F0A29|nr:kinase-like domain-containing protein [Gilbertella persicaria]KAI8047850.1 kinase-like domain-containing protein [Gilbertella persicaria]
MAQKLRNKSAGLRLELNTSFPDASQEDLASTNHSTSTSTSGNWREDIARLVHDEDKLGDLKPDDFENIRKLGEGAAGTVWLVKHKKTGLTMAKKTITVDPDPQLQRQILRELSFLKTCESPYIVSFYGAFLDDGETTIAICMEYCEGGSLEDIYKRANNIGGVIGETILANIADAVCKGLIYLHSQNVIHRDIKPSNILMTKKGQIKLCDLGVSGELINSLAETFTGTQYYMAPERIKGATYSVSSDIWSLGLTIIEVAQNRPALPPPGQPHLTIFELLEFIVNQPMPTVGQDRSSECQNFVETCLIKEPEKRPTPEQMLEHPFIKQRADPDCNIEGWLKELWGWS